jgi:hypothetical protein
VVLSVLVSLGLLVACGDSGSVDEGPASASLIQVSDLPAGAKAIESLPSGVCDPAQVLNEYGSRASKSSMFAVDGYRVQEAVGLFPARALTVKAYDALNARSRLKCIYRTIEFQGNLSVTILAPRDIDVGVEAQSVRFQVVRQDSGKRSSVEVASIRSGRAVASLIFLNATGQPSGSFTRDVIADATALLERGRVED